MTFEVGQKVWVVEKWTANVVSGIYWGKCSRFPEKYANVSHTSRELTDLFSDERSAVTEAERRLAAIAEQKRLEWSEAFRRHLEMAERVKGLRGQ